MKPPIDKNGREVNIGTKVRLLSLSGQWFDELPADEKLLVMSMIGEVFIIEEIDSYGQPWVKKSWLDAENGTCKSHSIALEPNEIEVVIT
jgi:hypothetical protein